MNPESRAPCGAAMRVAILALSSASAIRCDPVNNKPQPPKADTGADAEAGLEIGDPRWPNWPIPPDSPPASQYVVKNGIVHDELTNLDWAQRASSPMPYSDADGYCASLDLGGLTWRLPTRIELVSILDFVPKAPSQVFVSAFVQTDDFYISASPLSFRTNRPGAHWGVLFGAKTLDVDDPAALVSYTNDTENVVARCVHDPRGTVVGLGRRPLYSVNAGYLTDPRTGLALQLPVPEPAKSAVSQADAAKACEALSLGPWTTGWRLPTAKELYSVIDETRSFPALDPQFSASEGIVGVWTSPPLKRRVDLAQGAYYLTGDPFVGWCVHPL